MAQVAQPQTFVPNHLITPAEWKREVNDQLNATIPWMFTKAGQIAYSIGLRNMVLLDAPGGSDAHLLTMTSGTPEWQNIGTQIALLIPAGSITRNKLADSARLPIPVGNGGQFVRVNSTGTGFTSARVRCNSEDFSQLFRISGRGGGVRTWTVTGWQDEDIIILGHGFNGTNAAWDGEHFSDVPTSTTQAVAQELDQDFGPGDPPNDLYIDARRSGGSMIFTARGNRDFGHQVTVWRVREGVV